MKIKIELYVGGWICIREFEWPVVPIKGEGICSFFEVKYVSHEFDEDLIRIICDAEVDDGLAWFFGVYPDSLVYGRESFEKDEQQLRDFMDDGGEFKFNFAD